MTTTNTEYPATSDRSRGWLRYLYRKATTPDNWDKNGHPHPHWDGTTGEPILSWHRFDLIESSYAMALMADTIVLGDGAIYMDGGSLNVNGGWLRIGADTRTVGSVGGVARGLLVTDLTGVPSDAIATGYLQPNNVLNAYNVRAVLLVRDSSFETRRIRLVALGFHLRQIFGSYGVMAR